MKDFLLDSRYMEFQADISSLPEMLAFIRSYLAPDEKDSSFLRRLDLACEEILVNVISHAYSDKVGNEKLQIECLRKKGRRFEVRIIDQGPPFDPLELEVEVNENIPMSQRKIGGLGIFLVRKLVDEITYQRLGHENILTLTLHF